MPYGSFFGLVSYLHPRLPAAVRSDGAPCEADRQPRRSFRADIVLPAEGPFLRLPDGLFPFASKMHRFLSA